MDSDYLPSSDNESEISNMSLNSEAFDHLTEDDIVEITLDVFYLFESHMKNEIINISSPNFYSNIVDKIAGILFDEWINFQLISDDDEDFYEEIKDFVDQLLEVYMQFCNVPIRERKYSVDFDYENNTEKLAKQIQILQNIPQPTQKTKEWYEFRNGLISASNLWKVFGTESQRNSLIYEKCQPINYNQIDNFRTNTESAMHWGNKYEPVTVMIYEYMFGTKVGEFGCIQHPKYKFIGASPDGINLDPNNIRFGRMLEIKNIVNREITGIPKQEYWIQTQIQMEVCDLDECDFMETRFLEYRNMDAFYDDTEREYKCVILYFIDRDLRADSVPHYKYMPVEGIVDQETIDDWILTQRNESKNEGLVLFNTIYWYLEEYSCVLIERNREWFQAAVPKIEELWSIIEKERVEGYEHRSSKKKISVTMNTSDLSNSYVIKNMPLQNSICLVKLE